MILKIIPALSAGRKNQKGIAALITIIIVSIAGLVMAYSAAFLGLNDLDMGYTSERGGEAFAVADGCIDESLRRIRLDDTYTGSTFSIGDGTCEIEVFGSGATRTITATGTIDSFYSVLQADISITGNNIIITSWEEI